LKDDGAAVAYHERTSSSDVHSLIGISLVLGFVFMLLVDQCSVSRSRDNEGSSKSAERNITATVGLVVHAAEAPAAFGLVTFLLHEGLDRNRIRRHLLVFSLSAPLLALLTFFGIGQEGKETLSSVNATGIAMLFSAGTFLYVATVHVLPELTSRSGHSHGGSIIETTERKGLRTIELMFLIIGALLPLLLTLGHHH